jgi:CheY-like chemotaxis protein
MNAVLVITDDTFTYELVRSSCLGLDLDVLHAKDSYEGMRFARSVLPLVIFIDAANTLSYNGWITAKIIKNDQALKNVPVVALSDAMDAEELSRKALCQTVLPRLFAVREVRAYINSLMGQQV